MDFDVPADEEMTEYERLRQKNMKEFEAMMSEFADDINESVTTLNNYEKVQNNKRKRKTASASFQIPEELLFERRRSDRLLNVTPRFSYTDLEDDEDFESTKRKYVDNVDELERIVFRKKRSSTKKSTIVPYVAVENITNKYLENIAMRVVDKTYCSRIGTSCHQCRQKTLDSKTYCRSGNCVGVRGQFCGVCLKNRYGENAKDALLDPGWKCPPCRGLCNCSICRTRQGKRPTGILAPLAFQNGHKSVKDFLLSLNEKYDYVNDSPPKRVKRRKFTDDDQFFLGFERNLVNDGDLVGFNKDNKPVMSNS
ncbi:hypothetical protein MML48_1g02483 [Holotrichia oblita]|uniref:Uncharacterized protein n=1 Tax=Holotrichia oblita TaxID=644536 RepID=A0ACB9TUS5_HOLOL|nr:hypothetical protein MML48_1g02483 [Holotrichia oblita]